MHRVLLVGFGPFAGRTHNGSQTLVHSVAPDDLPSVSLRRTVLAVRWGQVEAELVPLVADFQPQLILGLGEGGPGGVTVETVGRNVRRGTDEADTPPPTPTVDDAGPAEKQANLALDSAWSDCAQVAVSTDAGAFLCNNLLYAIAEQPDVVAGFIHLPPQGDAAPDAYVASYKPVILEIIKRNLSN